MNSTPAAIPDRYMPLKIDTPLWMIDFEISEIRKFNKIVAPTADFDGAYTFYYDETNNIKKFYVRENDFNYKFTANFVLGGLVHSGQAPNV